MVERDKTKEPVDIKKSAIPWLKDVQEKKLKNPFGYRWRDKVSKEDCEK